MWKRLQAVLKPPKANQLFINSLGQETCGLPSEKIQEVMEWLGMSLFAAGYRAKAHMIWDNSGADFELDKVFRGQFKRHEPVFLYRCGDRTMQPPADCYWRLMGEHPSLRVYQLERKAS